jgi:hypothetical protein
MFLYEDFNSQRSEVPEMLISQVELPVSDAVIGLAVPDVPAALASLQNAFGLPVLAPLRQSSLRSAIPIDNEGRRGRPQAVPRATHLTEPFA